ncbi:MAG: response regulator [Candidatus Cyclobacteriaceae bacterium M3_2C_046]
MINYNTSIVIIEKNQDLQYVYRVLLETVQDYFLAGIYGSSSEFLKQHKNYLPDVVIIDLDLPDQEGMKLVKYIKQINHKQQILVLSSQQEKDLILEAFRNGAMGYIYKKEGPVALLQGLEELMNGGAPLSPQVAKKIITSFHKNYDHPFTRREMQVLDLFAQGYNPKKISQILEISFDTVKTYSKNIYSKLQVSSRVDAIEKARKCNFI